MPIIDHFGLLARSYEKFIPPSISEHLVDLLGIDHGLNLLDVGGGTGRVSDMLSDRFENIYLVDESHRMLFQAKSKGLELVRSHAEALPFSSGFFDRIIIIDALHHVAEQALTASELYRVLAPGGRLIIEEPNFEHLFVKILAAFERIALMRSRFLRPDAIGNLFDDKDSSIEIHNDGYTSWIVIDKQG